MTNSKIIDHVLRSIVYSHFL